MDIESVKTSYARWAPVYDKTFGHATKVGRKHAVDYINSRSGNVLEVGVGTGLSLPDYDPALSVTGIDFSGEMLEKARKRVADGKLAHVKELRQMDARDLDFPDDYFDTVTAMHIVSVVPEPERVMAEIARVCKPGGKVVITNHFARETGALAGHHQPFRARNRRFGGDRENDLALCQFDRLAFGFQDRADSERGLPVGDHAKAFAALGDDDISGF
jgi:phosphatidylethanolamine/phosphatidyl-N-methylethanolamine N-methyltransferase